MKSTGIVRKIDEIGRIVIPMDVRKNLDICEYDQFEIFVDGDKIILKKYIDKDIFDGTEEEDLIEYHGKKVSKKSIIELAKLAGLKISE